MRDYLYILIIAAVVTYLLTPMVRRASISIGALHAARSRDVHSEPTPLLGGVAMYAGLVAGLLVAERLRYLQQAFPSPRTVIGLLLAGGLLVLIGIVDDRWGMSAISVDQLRKVATVIDLPPAGPASPGGEAPAGQAGEAGS